MIPTFADTCGARLPEFPVRYRLRAMSEETTGRPGKNTAEQLISLAEAAELCGLSHDHLRKLVRSGTVWGVKIARNWVTSEAAVRSYLATERRPGPKPKAPSAQDDQSA